MLNHVAFLEKKYWDFFENAPTAYFCLDSAGRIHEANRAALALTRTEKRNLLGRTFASFLRPPSGWRLEKLCRRIVKSGAPERCELEWQRGDVGCFELVGIPWPRGNRLWVAAVGPLSGARSEARGALQQQLQLRVLERTRQLEAANRTLYVEIAERRRAVEELRREHRHLQLLHTLTGAANKATSWRDILAFALRSVCEYLDWPVGHAYVRSGGTGSLTPSGIWHQLNPPPFEAFRAATEAVQDGERSPLIARVLRVKAPVWTSDIAVMPGFVLAGAARAAGIRAALAVPVLVQEEVVSVLEFFTPSAAVQLHSRTLAVLAQAAGHVGRVFERERAESALRERERLAALGRLAAVFAHEVGNPLNSISTTLQMVLRSPDVSPAIFAELDEMRTEVVRLGALLDDFRAFSRAPLLKLERVDLTRIAEEVLRVVRARCQAAAVELRAQFENDLPPLIADGAKLKQLLLNLLSNAVDAMPGGGLLTIRTAAAGRGVVLEVKDTGTGVPEGIDIFEPFKTTKPTGTGLGLTVVQQIVHAHGGSVAYTTGPGKGTTFRVELPLEPPRDGSRPFSDFGEPIGSTGHAEERPQRAIVTRR